MASTIVTKNSSTASAVPVTGDLTQGELAVNVTDKKLYTKDSGGTVVKLVGGLGNQEANAVSITGGSINGTTVGATTASTGAFTTLSASSTTTLSGGTANGVAYLNGSKVVTTGSALTFDGTTLKASLGSSGATAVSNGNTLVLENSAAVGMSLLTPDANASRIYFGTASNNRNAFIYSDYNSGAQTLIFGLGSGATAATEQMRLTSTGLGIGTSSPVAKLDVKKTSNDTISRTNAVGGFGDWDSLGAGLLMQQTLSSPYGFALQAANAANSVQFPLLLNPSGGNVGIGTSSPAAKLQVVGESRFTNSSSAGLAAYYDSLTTSGQIAAYNWGGSAWLPLSLNGSSLLFQIQSTTRMTLDTSGNLLVGATADAGLGITIRPSSTVIQNNNAEADGFTFSAFRRSSVTIGSITQNGTTAVLYNTTSDQRLKENIQDAADASALVDALQVRQFDWKADGSHQRYGFVAQELVTVAPEAVHQPENPDEMMAVDYSKLVPMLVKEIQSLRARVAQLEAK